MKKSFRVQKCIFQFLILWNQLSMCNVNRKLISLIEEWEIRAKTNKQTPLLAEIDQMMTSQKPSDICSIFIQI